MNPGDARYRHVQKQACGGDKRLVLASALLLFMPALTAAQESGARPRIAAAQVDDTRLTVLRGNTHPLARPQYDQGKVDPSFKLERITLMFQPTAAQQADLDGLLGAQQNPTSPNFHQWLTPEEYGNRFGIAQSDLNKVTAWLQAQGFDIVDIPRSRNSIIFNGTAAQVESALHSEVHGYTANGTKFYANSAEPSVPAALADVVLGFRGLHNFPVKPRGLKSQPNFTSHLSGNHYVSPGDFATIYDLNPLYSGAPAIDGTGQKIAIVGQSNIVRDDIDKFRSLSGLPATLLTPVLATGSTDPGVKDGDVQESSLDIEWAGAVAKNATIIFVYSSQGVFDALFDAVSRNLAPIISISYGSCEPTFSASDISVLVAAAQQANAQGITIVSSTGDGGATDCDGDLGHFPAILGLNVDVPASLPYVTGIGGTEFNEGNGAYWKSDPNMDIINSALSYIPEMVWNDTQVENKLVAGGGGASSIFGKPSWQTGTGVPNDGVRDVPDISLGAATAHDPYLVCTQIQATPGAGLTSSCQNGFRISSADNNFTAFGGTSFGAPLFAGILALVNQKTASSGQGNVNYILYPLAASFPSAFHDIIVGDNTSPCLQGTESCPNGGSIGFGAGTGYDLATGLGSIDATVLVNAWSSITPSPGSKPILSSISPTSISAGSGDFPLTATGTSFATNALILWNGSTAGVTMQAGGTSTSITATISHNLVAHGTTASITVTDDAAKAGESSAAQTFTVNSAGPPVNDNIANAIAVTTSSFTSTVDNSAATPEATDPVVPCVSGSTSTKTVWWTLTLATSGSVIVSTIGSVYDTTLSVWTGTPVSLANVACNDDVSRGLYKQSLLTFSVTAGTKYYIMVAPFGPTESGGKTVLNVASGSLPVQPPSITSVNSTTFTVGIAGLFTVTATGFPTPTFGGSGVLPMGVTFNGRTGVLTGTPAAGTAGTYPITFTAQNGHAPDASQNFTLTVNASVLSASPSSQTVAAGSPATYMIMNSGSLSYALTCSGLPKGAACPAVSVPANSTASLVITTMSRSGVPPSWPRGGMRLNLWPETLTMLGISIIGLLAGRRRRILTFVPVSAFVLFLVFFVAGCGGSGGSGGGGGGNSNGTPAGPYTITVTGTPSGGAAQTINVTLNVT